MRCLRLLLSLLLAVAGAVAVPARAQGTRIKDLPLATTIPIDGRIALDASTFTALRGVSVAQLVTNLGSLIVADKLAATNGIAVNLKTSTTPTATNSVANKSYVDSIAAASVTNAPIQVATISALRAYAAASELVNGQQFAVGGYMTNGDGGGGVFVYDSANTNADNGGSTIVSAVGQRFVQVADAVVNPAQWGARGLKWPGVSLIDQTVDSTMDPVDGATNRFNWINQTWAGLAIASGKLRLTEATGPSQMYLNGILYNGASSSGSGGINPGQPYTIRLKVRLVSGTAHTLWVGVDSSPTLLGFTIPASKLSDGVEREFRGVFTSTLSGSAPLYLGVYSGNGTGAVYDIDDVEICEGVEDFGTEISSITRSTTTATAMTATAHGLTTGERIIISGVIGADQALYNGGQTVTVTSPTTFTYTMTGTPGASATLGFARVLPDDTATVQGMFTFAKGMPVRWPRSRSFHVTDTIDASVSSGVDLNNGRLAFHLRGDKRGLMAGRVENGEVNILFGTGADSGSAEAHFPVSFNSVTGVQGFQAGIFRNLRIGCSSDRNSHNGIYALSLLAPYGCTVENVLILPKNTLSRGVFSHWAKVNATTAGVYGPRNLKISNVRIPELGDTNATRIGIYLSNHSGTAVENVNMGTVDTAIAMVSGDLADGFDAAENLDKFRAPVVFRNIWARDVRGVAVSVNQKTYSDALPAYSIGSRTAGSFTVTNVTNGATSVASRLFKPGDRVLGTGIPWGTVVVSSDATTVTMNRRATTTTTENLDAIKEFPVVIEDSRFIGNQGTNTSNYGVALESCGNVTFSRVAFDRFNQGIRLQGPSANLGASPRNVTFRDCTITRSYGDGAFVRGARNVIFDNCRFAQNGQGASTGYNQIRFAGELDGYLPDIDGVTVSNCQFGNLGSAETAQWAAEFVYTHRTRHIRFYDNTVLANGSAGECFEFTVFGANSGHDLVDLVRDNFVHPSLKIVDPYSGLLFFPVGYDVTGVGPRRTFLARTAANPNVGTWNYGESARILGTITNGVRNGWVVSKSGTGGPESGATATTTTGSPWILTSAGGGDYYAVGMWIGLTSGNPGGQILEIDGDWIKLSFSSVANVSGFNIGQTSFGISDASYVQGSAPTSGTVTSVGVTAPAAGITSSGGPITSSGNVTLALANDLAAVEGLSGTGIVRRTATDTWSAGTAVGLTTEVTGTLPPANGGTGITALGTGVAAALGGNVGSSEAIVVNGGALGTPLSGNLANATGLPISTGVSGLGSGVATLLGGTSSGTGGIAGTASPTFTGTVNAGSIVASSDITAATTGDFRINGRARYGATADGAMYVLNNAASQSASMSAAVPTRNKTSAYTALLTESACTFANSGATALVTITLPTGFTGLWYKFDVRDTDGIKIQSAAGDQIRIAGTVSAATGYVQSVTFGSILTLEWDGSDWRATSAVGTWVMDGTTTLKFRGITDLSTDITGTLPVANGGTGITALGTGVATALGVNVGSAGAPVVNGGALGTPSSGSIASTLITVTENTQTGTTYTVLSSDNGKVVTLNNFGAITVTVPTLSAGFSCTFIQKGAGQVTFTTSGTTVSNAHSQTKTFGQYAVVTLYGLSSTAFVLAGDTGT